MNGRNRCTPQFSSEDADLAALKWRLNRYGYARITRNFHEDGQPKRPVSLLAHRLVGARVAGRDLRPDEVVDHINFDLLDNRRENLRVVSWMENSQHRQATGASGYRGVVLHKKTGKWQAQVKHRGTSYYCGLHESREDAAAVASAKRAALGFMGVPA